MITFNKIRPHPRLSQYIKHYWTMKRVSSSKGEVAKTDIFSNDGIDLIFNFGDPYLTRGDSVGSGESIIAGAMSSPIGIEMPGDVDILGVSFEPGYMKYFTGVPAYAVTDSKMYIREMTLFGQADLRCERLSELSLTEKINYLEYSLLLKCIDQIDSNFPEFISIMKRYQGGFSIGDIEGYTGLGSRQIQRKFKELVGLSPKTFNSIVRFQSSLSLLKKGAQSLVDVAYSLGYADQAHFNKDFKRFSGSTPLRYVKKRMI